MSANVRFSPVQLELRGTGFAILWWNFIGDGLLMGRSAENSSPATAVHSKGTILLIDDSDYIIEGTAALLRFEGYQVLTATNGRDGVELARRHHPDLVICDISMPEMDGYEVLRQLRSDPETATLRFIFLTARADRANMRTGMDLGADDYLVKPFSIDELLAAIEAQWKKREIFQRNLEEVKLNITYALPHEFRTALNQILGLARSLKSAAGEHELVEEIAEDITASAHRLLRITENFLVYAQLELLSADRNAAAELSRHRTDEAAAVAADLAQTKALHYNRSGDLRIGPLPEGVAVAMSSENFHKVLDELLDNAFKFSEPTTPVELTVALQPPWLEVVISDRGCGMTAAQISNIGSYRQFNRLLNEQQGVGLGLVIAKRIVELHGGSFRIESEPGAGTRVICQLPLAT